MATERKLKVGTVVKFEDDDFEDTGNLYLLGSKSMAYLNYTGIVTSTSRPENDEKLVPVVVVDDEDEFIKKILQSVPMDHSWRGKIQSAIVSTLSDMRRSYFEPSLAEKMYTESPRKASTWTPWEKLDDAEAAGWKKAAEIQEKLDEAYSKMGSTLFAHNDENRKIQDPGPGGLQGRPIKDTPQA